MLGRHMGELKIKTRTNDAERLLWKQGMRDLGDNWILAQTPVHVTKPFQASVCSYVIT